MTTGGAQRRESLMITMWLMLYALMLLKKATGDDIGKKLGMLWYPLHKRDSSIRLVFPEMFDGGNMRSSDVKVELARFLLLGFTEITKWSDGVPLWSITETGRLFLKHSWENVKPSVSPVVEPEGKAFFE